MTQDEIIEMARQAWKDSGEGWVDTAWFNDRVKALEAFAKLVDDKATAKEREACAQVAEHSFGVIGSTIAQAIRARGEA